MKNFISNEIIKYTDYESAMQIYYDEHKEDFEYPLEVTLTELPNIMEFKSGYDGLILLKNDWNTSTNPSYPTIAEVPSDFADYLKKVTG